jgi:hypothetical protein
VAKADGAVGLNLDIEPRHYTAGAEATRQQRAREKRLSNAELGKSVIIRPEHRLNGAEAANRAKALERDEEATPVRPDRAKPILAPFARAHRAFADLCAAFNYPPAVVPVFGPVRVHRIKVPEDNHGLNEPRPQNLPRSARPKHSDIYRMRHGIQERLCRSCGQWLPLTLDHYRWRNDRATGSWNGECRPCDNLRRRETIARRQAGD